jgi:hypothetical protein
VLIKKPYFFGYGSLVNLSTHSYKTYKKTYVDGWRRRWCHTILRSTPFLSVYPVAKQRIYGLTAEVTDDDWAGLDKRETGYQRLEISSTSLTGEKQETQIYSVPNENITDTNINNSILLSYLDCVVQGYLQQFGDEGAAFFFETTDGWNIKINDDRLNPIYPRHVEISKSQKAFVDHHLAIYN